MTLISIDVPDEILQRADFYVSVMKSYSSKEEYLLQSIEEGIKIPLNDCISDEHLLIFLEVLRLSNNDLDVGSKILDLLKRQYPKVFESSLFEIPEYMSTIGVEVLKSISSKDGRVTVTD